MRPMEYYDRLLGGMLASLLVGAAVGLHPAVRFNVGLLGGAVVATVFLWDAIVRRPPIPTSEPGYAAAAVIWHVVIIAFLIAGL